MYSVKWILGSVSNELYPHLETIFETPFFKYLLRYLNNSTVLSILDVLLFVDKLVSDIFLVHLFSKYPVA